MCPFACTYCIFKEGFQLTKFLDIYKATCIVCKNDILLTNYFANSELDEGDYVARYNPRTKKCHLCKK